MRLRTIFLSFVAILFMSCGKSHFANSVMKDIGDGKYVPVAYGNYSNKTSILILNDEIFSMAGFSHQEALQKSKLSNFEDYFDIEVMFDNFSLLETIHVKEDLLTMVSWSKNENEMAQKAMEMGRDYDKLNDENFVSINESTYICTRYKNIDQYSLKYKISTKQADQIAFLTIIKIPREGYRVTSFKVL